MNWKDAIPTVARVAPSVASVLAGPAVGGAVNGAAQMVTSLLGIENTPEALIGATQNPEQRAELVRINNEHRRELEQMRINAEIANAQEHTKRLSETQATLRAELQHDGWFKSGWRPAIGWIFGLSLGGIAAAIIVSIFRDPSLLVSPEFVGMLVWLLGTMGAALGINVRERTKNKQLAVGQRPSSFMEEVRTKGNQS